MNRCIIICASLLFGLIVYGVWQTGLIRNYLPDILWGFALCHTALLMLENKFHPVFVIALLVMPFVTEAGQLNLFPGTFDPFDLLVYAGLYTLFFHPQIIGLCKKLSKLFSAA
jgi:hypothetical protein